MKPDWCPADIWETAGMWLVGRAHLEPSDREWVALAIFNERERCAAVARCVPKAARERVGLDSRDTQWIELMEHVVTGIEEGISVL